MLLLFIPALGLQAQQVEIPWYANLVPNSGFEEVEFEPVSFTDRGQVFGKAVKAWYAPNKASTDLISPSFPGRIGKKRVYPHSGKRMAGLSINIRRWGEYTSVPLSISLKPGIRYYGAFWVALAVSAGYGDAPQPFNRYFGMMFGEKIEQYTSEWMMVGLPAVFATDSTYIEPGEWVKVGGYFTVEKPADHLHIGQFIQADLQVPLMNGYFLVDDVSVVEAEELIFPEPVFPDEPKAGQLLTLEKVFFAFNESKLEQASFDQLNELADWLQQNPGLRVRIQGHTDASGSESFNRDLSRRRAEAVVDYLIQQGIESDRLESIGYGESRPDASNATAKGREKNRRVEVQIIQ